MIEELGFQCCFCNTGITENNINPIDINIITNEARRDKTGSEQLFFAHFHCFKERLHQYFKAYFIQESDFRLYENEVLIIKNKDCLIKKITELKEIDQWKVIYYGLTREHINSQFVMDYCYALIEQKNCSDQFVLDIAALTNKDDLYNISKNIIKKINNHEEIRTDKNQFYSKIWSYLSLAADMCAEKIID